VLVVRRVMTRFSPTRVREDLAVSRRVAPRASGGDRR
jgi:hypothetical protein